MPGGADGAGDGAPLEGFDGVEAVVGVLSGMVPGAVLAGVVERVVAPLLAPAVPADDTAAGPAGGPVVPADGGAAGDDGAGGGGGLLGGLVGPGERALAEAAGSVVVDGRGVGALVGLGAEVLSELVAACGRLAAWAQWAQAVVAACMARCPEMGGLPYQPDRPDRPDSDDTQDDGWDEGRDGWDEGRGDGLSRCRALGGSGAVSGAVAPAGRWSAAGEVACRAGVSRLVASRLVDRGAGLLDARLAPVCGLHRVGLLDSSKTSVVVRRLAGEPVGVARVVQDRVLGRAVHRTPAQVGREVDRALTGLDPAGAGRRARRGAAGRHVTRPREAGAGVCQMRALLPRADAVLLDAALDAVAASARATGDSRTPGQLRADALTAMTLHTLRTTHHTTTTTTATTKTAETATTEAAETATAAAGAAGAGAGGPAGAALDPAGPEAPARPARPEEGPEELVAGPGLVGFTGFEGPPPGPADTADPTGPGALGAGAGPAGPAGPAGVVEPLYVDSMGLTPDGVPLEGLLTALSGLVCHTSPWWTPSGTDPAPLPPGLTVSIDVTVPLNHLTDLLPDDTAPPQDDPPATTTPTTTPACGPGTGPAGPVGASLGGRGRSVPVPAAVARALAAGGTWRRLVTDPLSGAVTDVGRTRYRPPAALADLVRARDASCTHPGCERPARGCEIDHVRPWAEGGTTSLENLTCLCRAHHRLKHTPGWALTRTPDGALVWRTPTGARYQRDNDGTITLLPRRTGPGQKTRPATRLPQALARAITPQTLDRLHKGLTNHTSPDTTPGDLGLGHHTSPLITTHGPHPNENPGDYETTPYHPTLHTLGLTPLLDTIPPF
ncbi:hypothetical protein AIF0345_1522 [Actinomyces israelii]|nr:hypothetical protein AIF0345_1522 [Actinomyces israelii]